MSQVELDKLLADSEEERDELVGAEEASTEKHRKALAQLNTTAQELERKLWSAAGDKSGEYKEKHEEYAKKADNMTRLEEEVHSDAERVSSVRAEMRTLHADLEMALVLLVDCDCQGSETVLAHAHRLLHTPQLAALRVAQAVGGVKKLKTVFAIEKLEAEMVSITKDTQGEQAVYDKKVRTLQDAMEASKRNASSVDTKQVKAQDLLAERAEAQARGLTAVTAMAESKRSAATAAEAGLAAAKGQLKELDETLIGCGCK